jgi:heme-degrading monooxygenase HmoA
MHLQARRSTSAADKHSGSAGASSPFAVISKFAVANGMTEQVKQAFQSRPHVVDDVDGFLRMEVISPLDAANEIWLLTFWRDQASFTIWHKSHRYKECHAGIPKGLKLVAKSVDIRHFQCVSQ